MNNNGRDGAEDIRKEWADLHSKGYAVYSGNMVYSMVLEDMMSQFSSDYPPRRILDIGCGNGDAMRWLGSHFDSLSPAGGQYRGIDISEVAVESMKRKWRSGGSTLWEIDGRVCDGEGNIPYDDGYFDAVVSCLVLQHVHPRYMIRYFSEMRRVLRPGGKVLLHTTRWPHVRQNEEFLKDDLVYDALIRDMVTGGMFSHDHAFVSSQLAQNSIRLLRHREVQDAAHLAPAGAFWNAFLGVRE